MLPGKSEHEGHGGDRERSQRRKGCVILLMKFRDLSGFAFVPFVFASFR